MSKAYIAAEDEERSFYAAKKTALNPYTGKNHTSHAHNYDEIYIFLRGDATLVVGGVYFNKLKPYDIIPIRKNEVHYVKNNSTDNRYDRIIIKLNDEFYQKNNCEIFKDVFSKMPPDTNRLIPADVVKASEIFDSIIKLEKYIDESAQYSEIMTKCAIMEILYSVNRLNTPKTDYKNNIIKQIIDYINDNIKSKISLDDIARHFFMSKCHMCRIFKNATGLTITQYITSRRISLADELYKSGKSITDACLEAGFGSYTNFYKAYIKEKGSNPRAGMNIT